MLTEEQIQDRYNQFVELLRPDPRFDSLMAMYALFNDELQIAPASSKVQFHNCFPGGYIDHTVRVAEAALKMASLYKTLEGDIDFTKQELIFAALHHDLGKLGHPDEGTYYVEQDSDWHRKRGELYKKNDNLQYFKAPERGLFLLQKYGISMTQNEWLAIKLSDGLYDDGNKSYLINFAPHAMKTNLPYIIQWADHISSRVENDKTKFKF
jgi:hypothetical protein